MYKTALTLTLIWWAGVGAFAQKNPITEAEYRTLKANLEAIYKVHQGMRDTLVKMKKAHGMTGKVGQYAMKILTQDKRHLKTVQAVIEQYGWLPKSKVGEKAALALVYVIQNSNVKTMEKHLPIMKTMADKGETFPRFVAMVEDLVLMHKNKKQRYGTQVWGRFKNGKQEFFIWPIEDVANVEQRRKKVGLKGTVKEYARKNNYVYDPSESLPTPQNKKNK